MARLDVKVANTSATLQIVGLPVVKHDNPKERGINNLAGLILVMFCYQSIINP